MRPTPQSPPLDGSNLCRAPPCGAHAHACRCRARGPAVDHSQESRLLCGPIADPAAGVIGNLSSLHRPARNRRSNRGTRHSCPMRAQRCDFDVATACCHLAALALFARRPLGSVGSHPVDQPSSQRVSCLWCAGDRIRTRSTWVDAPLCGAGGAYFQHKDLVTHQQGLPVNATVHTRLQNERSSRSR